MIKIGYILSCFSENEVNFAQIKIDGIDCVLNARLLHSYLGEEYKNVWQPKVGSKVLVCFINESINSAVILGFLEKKNDKSLLNFTEDGDKGFFQHENGVKVEFFNKENERKVEITTPKEEFITFDLDNQTLEVKNNKDQDNLRIFVNFKEFQIEIKSDQLKIESKNIIINGESLAIETKNNVEIKGGSVKIESSGSIDIQASASSNIKGQAVNLN